VLCSLRPRIVKRAKVTLSSSVDLDKSSPTTPTWPGTWIIKGTVHWELLCPTESWHTWERGEVKWYVAAGWACCIHLKCKKRSNKKIHVLGVDTDPDQPYPDRHALNADPDLHPAKLCGSDPSPLRIQIHNTAFADNKSRTSTLLSKYRKVKIRAFYWAPSIQLYIFP
jgi:hypothetical protein